MTDWSLGDETTERNAAWLFVGVVAVAYLSTLALRPDLLLSPKTLVLVVMGVLYTFAGTYGESWCETQGKRWPLVGYFAFQIVLSTLIIYLSWDYPGFMALILFPLVSQAAVVFPLPGVALVTGAILLFLVVSLTVAESWQAAIQSSSGMLAGMVFIVLFTRIAVRERQARLEVERLATELENANLKLREYALQVEELATTQERNRLAREIHDSLGHFLTVINVQLEAAKAVLERDPARSLSAIEKAQTLTKDGLAEVRRSVAALRASPIDDLALPDALQPLLEECRTGGLVAELTIVGAPCQLDRRAKSTLYRVAQEGLTNVQKHAQAGRVDVILNYAAPGTVRLTVQDDGLGAEAHKAADSFGLLGIRERVNLLDGQVRISSSPDRGFTLEVQIPIRPLERMTDDAHSGSAG